MINGLLIALIAILAWILLMMALAPRIRGSKRFQLIGPLLMIKSIKPRGILDKIAEKFPAVGFSRFSVALVLATGVFAVFFLFYGAYLSTTIRTATTAPLTYYVGLPGINPIIPVTYGIPAFIVSVVIHEVFHGIVARKHDMKVRSVGTLFFVAPIGAFVEPDEEEMQKADPVVRRRVFAAGAGINMVIGIAMVLILSFVLNPAAQPIHDGVYVQSISSEAPLSTLIHPGDEIISMGNYTGTNVYGALENSSITPGTMIPVVLFNGTTERTVQYPAGLQIISTLQGYPAAQEGMKSGSIIYSINGTQITSVDQMTYVLDNITAGSIVPVVTMSYSGSPTQFSGTFNYYNLTTADKYQYYQQNDPSINSQSYKNESFIGVTTAYLGVSSGISLGDIKPVIFVNDLYTSPWKGFLSSLSLPLSGLSPVPYHLTQLFHTNTNPALFWGTVNMVYWLFWVNILLGITNALPLLILDGNQFFKDTFVIAGRRKRLSALKNETVLNRIMSILNVIVIVLLLWEIIVPRIM